MLDGGSRSARSVAALLLTATASFASDCAWAAEDGDADAGRKLAERHCSRCHVVGDFNRYGGIDSTPSFQLLARRDDWRERFQTFYERRPHPVFVQVPDVERWTDIPSHVAEFKVTPQNIDDLVAFVKTLQPE